MTTRLRAYRTWTVTVTRGVETTRYDLSAFSRSDAIKTARKRVAADMPFYKTPLDEPGLRIRYSAKRKE